MQRTEGQNDLSPRHNIRQQVTGLYLRGSQPNSECHPTDTQHVTRHGRHCGSLFPSLCTQSMDGMLISKQTRTFLQNPLQKNFQTPDATLCLTASRLSSLPPSWPAVLELGASQSQERHREETVSAGIMGAWGCGWWGHRAGSNRLPTPMRRSLVNTRLGGLVEWGLCLICVYICVCWGWVSGCNSVHTYTCNTAFVMPHRWTGSHFLEPFGLQFGNKSLIVLRKCQSLATEKNISAIVCRPLDFIFKVDGSSCLPEGRSKDRGILHCLVYNAYHMENQAVILQCLRENVDLRPHSPKPHFRKPLLRYFCGTGSCLLGNTIRDVRI